MWCLSRHRGGLGSSPDGVPTICATHEEVPLPLSYEDIGSLHDCKLSSIGRASRGWRLKGKDKIDWAQGSWHKGSGHRWNRGPVRKMAMCWPKASLRASSATTLGSKADLWTQRYKQEREHRLFKGFQLQGKAYGYLLNMGGPDPVISYPHSKNRDGVPAHGPISQGPSIVFKWQWDNQKALPNDTIPTSFLIYGK